MINSFCYLSFLKYGFKECSVTVLNPSCLPHPLWVCCTYAHYVMSFHFPTALQQPTNIHLKITRIEWFFVCIFHAWCLTDCMCTFVLLNRHLVVTGLRISQESKAQIYAPTIENRWYHLALSIFRKTGGTTVAESSWLKVMSHGSGCVHRK